ncbi:MAG TPA: phytanoyl-CoA dioxygenase family protein [Byssovorax sp.]
MDPRSSFVRNSHFVARGLFAPAELLALERACGGGRQLPRPRRSLLTPGAAPEVLAFARDPRILALLEGLSRPGEAAIPRVRDIHYYAEQVTSDWDGDWHRDGQRADPEADREGAATVVHARVALVADACLEIVPGSHARPDSREERAVRKGSRRAGAMPGALRVDLDAGDVCVFHAWSIHRATYRRTPPRRTLDVIYAFDEPRRSWPD